MSQQVTLHNADARHVLWDMDDNSVDSIITDPPYALVSVLKRFGSADAAPAKHGSDGLYARASAGFMGETWDTGEVAFAESFWAECLRVLKPGGHVLAMGGTRTYHRLACAIEDAGFEVRDQLAWIYGTGFPKSHDLGDGRGTALKPAWEPICLARKNLSEKTIAANLERWGVGALWIDRSRVPGDLPTSFPKRRTPNDSYVLRAGFHKTEEETAVANPLGRWPASIVHDGSQEVLDFFPDGNGRFFYGAKASKADREEGTTHLSIPEGQKRANFHPTVKPTPLMGWQIGLVTPPGGVVLDPFMGSGSTGKAAIRGGFRFIGIEKEAKYMPIARARIEFEAQKALKNQWDGY